MIYNIHDILKWVLLSNMFIIRCRFQIDSFSCHWYITMIYSISAKIQLDSMKVILPSRFLVCIGWSMELMFLIRSSTLFHQEQIWAFIFHTGRKKDDLLLCMVLLKNCFIIESKMTCTCECIHRKQNFNPFIWFLAVMIIYILLSMVFQFIS